MEERKWWFYWRGFLVFSERAKERRKAGNSRIENPFCYPTLGDGEMRTYRESERTNTIPVSHDHSSVMCGTMDIKLEPFLQVCCP